MCLLLNHLGCVNNSPNQSAVRTDPTVSETAAEDQQQTNQVLGRTRLSVNDIRERHNQRVSQIGSIWARSHFQTAFIHDGSMRAESGNAVLMSKDLSTNLFLSLTSRTGQAKITIGHNPDEFWIIYHDDNRAFFGKMAGSAAFRPDLEEEWSIRPAAIPTLLGARKIPQDSQYEHITDESLGDYFVFTIHEMLGGVVFKVWLSDSGEECNQVSMYSDIDSRLLATSRLSSYETFDDSRDFPARIPREVLFDTASGRITTRLTIHDARSAAPRGPIPDEAFQLDRYLSRFRKDQIVELP